MNDVRKKLILRLGKLVNVAAITASFAAVWLLAYTRQMSQPVSWMERAAVFLLFAALYVVFARVYDAFLISQCRISEAIGSQVIAALMADLFAYVVTCLVLHRVANVLPMLIALLMQTMLAVIWCYYSHQWYFDRFPPKETAIIYDDDQSMEQLIREYGLEKKFRIRETLPVSEYLENPDCLAGLEAVFLTDLHSHERNVVLKNCIQSGIVVYVIPRIGDVIMSGAAKTHMFHLPVLRAARYSPSPEYLVLKRGLDLLAAGLALLVLSPLMLITSLFIWLGDRGPVFYRQTRLTRNGKRFSLLKFRSMRVDAEADGVARLSRGEQDPRITPVGHVIRKFRIDELPQLLNVLRGDMSIVGPRPERPEIAEEYERLLPEFRLRLQTKAGLTGYAQVYGKYNTDPYHKLQMDLMYIANPGILEDLRICFATIKVLFKPDSTEGIGAEQTTAMDRSVQEAETTAASGRE